MERHRFPSASTNAKEEKNTNGKTPTSGRGRKKDERWQDDTAAVHRSSKTNPKRRNEATPTTNINSDISKLGGRTLNGLALQSNHNKGEGG